MVFRPRGVESAGRQDVKALADVDFVFRRFFDEMLLHLSVDQSDVLLVNAKSTLRMSSSSVRYVLSLSISWPLSL